MAALTITAANVLLTSGPTADGQIAGEAFDAGACIYQADNGKWLKAQADGTAVQAGSNNIGMALSSADADGSRFSVALPGAVVAIGTGTAGVVYVPGDTAGAYNPVADQGTTDKITVAALGIGSNSLLLTRVYNAGSVLA
jgi:hypothetical protein